MTTLHALSEVFKAPNRLVSAETSLVFASSMQPSETSTDDKPPGWSHRKEQWSIDELLGVYNASEQKITIYKKGIEYVAGGLNVPQQDVEYIVRIHEWGHAVFHLGVTQEKSFELANASLANVGSAPTRASSLLKNPLAMTRVY